MIDPQTRIVGNVDLARHPVTQINIIDAVWIKQMHFEKAGDFIPGHTHTHDHSTMLVKGRFKVTVNDTDTEFTAPHLVYIKKELIHRIEALEADSIAYCIHAIRDYYSGDMIDPATVPSGVDIESII